MRPAALVLAASLAAAAQAATSEVRIKGTAEGSTLAGVARLEETPEGVRLTARLSGLPPGEHGFHVHEHGSCERAGEAAGGHYNPRGAPHGSIAEHGPAAAHAGDMGNIAADARGEASVDVLLPGLRLRGGTHNLEGRALVVHERRDDLGQPAGNAGGRIGCGVIGR